MNKSRFFFSITAKSNLSILLFTLLAINLSIVSTAEKQVSKPPFIDPDTLHDTRSQFQFNLILNQNRNLPVFFFQYSRPFSRQPIQSMIKGAFNKQPDIALALIVDCRNFSYDMNNTLRICDGFDLEKANELEKKQQLQEKQKKVDTFFRFNYLNPNPIRIKEKGHQLSKNHDSQNLQDLNTMFNDQLLAKIIRNEMPDFVHYIQDNYDMEEFLQTKSQFKFAKKSKILFFDQNLQAPMFLKKLAARLDGKIKIGVTDNFRLAKKHDAYIDSVLLMEYNFITQTYDTQKISFQQGNQLKSILKSQPLKKYLKIKKYRDIVLDFQHKDPTIYNMSNLAEVNQLISHNRLIVLQISTSNKKYDCQNLANISSRYQVFLNYICFSREKIDLLRNSGLQIQEEAGYIYIIDQTLKNSKKVVYQPQTFNAYEYLPQTPPRQTISVESEAENCLKTAMTSKRDPVIYWYNDKQNKNTLRLLSYFNSLPEVTSLIHFCQIYLPDKDLIQKYQLNQNCLFSMRAPNQRGQMQKWQFKQALQFISIKMFLRQLSINQMIKVYEQKLASNTLTQIKSAQDLTKQCFNKQCLVGLMAPTKFRYDSQITSLKQIKMEMSESPYNFVWIDGNCHWDIAKQLKLIGNKQKQIDRSYIFYYKQKTNEYALMKSIQQNKFWVKKDVKKWMKKLKQSNQIKRLKFGIDIQDKICQKIQEKKQNKKEDRRQQNKKSQKVKSEQL